MQRALRAVAYVVYAALMAPGILATGFGNPALGLGLIGAANAWWFGLMLGQLLDGRL